MVIIINMSIYHYQYFFPVLSFSSPVHIRYMEGTWGIVVVPCPFLWPNTTIGAIRLFFTGDILPVGRASIIVGDRSTRITTDLLYTNIYSFENTRIKVKLTMK